MQRKYLSRAMRQLRKERGLTQQSLAGRMGVDRDNYAQIERESGRYSMNVHTVYEVARGLGVTGITIFALAEDMEKGILEER